MTTGFADDFETDTRPQDDLYWFTNGGWVSHTEIPQDRSRYGAFDMLVEASREAMRTIVESAAKSVASDQPPSADTPEWRVGALYASFMDADRVQELGWNPILADVAAVANIADSADLVSVVGELEKGGVPGFFGMYVTADAGDPETEIGYITQGGLGLPDKEYYESAEFESIREAYASYLELLFSLAAPAFAEVGWEVPADAPRRVIELETQIAATHWDKADTRDAVRTYNKVDRATLEADTPGFGWAAWLTGLDAPDGVLDHVVVAQPDALAGTVGLLSSVSTEDWKAWLMSRLLTATAAYLPDEVSDARFDFYQRTLSGVPEQQPRWKRGVALVESLVGDDAGQLYVADHYPERAAERMDSLVANVIAAFRARIETLEWMGPETRAEALEKLSRFRAKVGKPARWRDYSAFVVSPDDLLGNVRRGHAVETARELAKIGKPVDRDEWLMTPQTVNAYYHPLLNEIVFPAAILQPPFFSADAPDPVNYGGIGAVIAHEIGHGFDDQGSRFDGSGTLRDWWTESDREAFDSRAKSLVKQFSVLSPRDAPDNTVNGELTVGENIGDLCGIELSFRAYRLAAEEAGTGRENTTIGDQSWTDEQLFFLNWAQLWRSATRPEEARRLLSIDPHSPPDLRANTVRNVDAFHEAFNTTEADHMWLAPDDRVRVF